MPSTSGRALPASHSPFVAFPSHALAATVQDDMEWRGMATLIGAARLMHCGARDVSHALIDNTYQLRRYNGHASRTP